MASEAELIARIEDDPDDRDGFVVYGDWLLEHGDPRGELVALHANGRDADAEQMLAAQAPRLLGPALAHARDLLELTWHLGFARAAAIRASDVDQALAILAAVTTAPACRFLRRLEIQVMIPGAPYHRIDAELAAQAQPRTLSEIVLGQPGDHQPSDALLAAFPRIPRRTTTWDSIVEAVSEHVDTYANDPRVFSIENARIGDLDAPAGCELSTRTLMHALAIELGDGEKLGVLPLLRAACTPRALDRFACALNTITDRENARLAPEDMRWAWAYGAVAALGGPRTAFEVARTLRAGVEAYQPNPWAIPDAMGGYQVGSGGFLARIATPLARLELHYSHPTFGPRMYGDLIAAGALEASLAREGADPVDELDPDLEERFAELDLRVLDQLVATGFGLPLRDAIALFVDAPRAPRAAGLVWVRWRQGAPASTLSRLVGRAEPRRIATPCLLTPTAAVDRHGRALGIDLDERVHLAHPADLDDDLLAIWRPLQRERGCVVRQLDRHLPLAPRLGATLANLRARLRPFPPAELLSRRGFDQLAGSYAGSGRFARSYTYGDSAYIIEINPARSKITCSSEPPAAVVHELARDLLT